jgi:threonine aldolase
MPDLIDLRSDTVSRPTPEMRRAMADAEVGDDVFGDDPTVIALEERAAELTGKEAGLFVASGTMGNLVAHMAQVPRGGEIIAEAESHLAWDEAAGHAVITGASVRPILARPDGTLDEAAVRSAFSDDSDPHLAPTALLVIENTHAMTGGQPLGAGYMRAMGGLAHELGIPMHVDGARLFNAVVALDTTARELLSSADSATFCLSKGLACPVGSVVVGTRELVRKARRARKMVGGGMRQVGILAAAGLIALRDGPSGMIERLAEDHANAQRLAVALRSMTGITRLEPARVRTNFVLFGVGSGDGALDLAMRARFMERCAADGVLLVAYPHGLIRACTHYGIEASHIDRTIEVIRAALADVGVAPSAVGAASAG